MAGFEEAGKYAVEGAGAGAMTGNPWLAVGGAVGGGLYGFFKPKTAAQLSEAYALSLMRPDYRLQRMQSKTGPDINTALKTAISRGGEGGVYGTPKYQLGDAYKAMGQARSESDAKFWATQQAGNIERQKLGGQMLAGLSADEAKVQAAKYGTGGAWYMNAAAIGEGVEKMRDYEGPGWFKGKSTPAGSEIPAV